MSNILKLVMSRGKKFGSGLKMVTASSACVALYYCQNEYSSTRSEKQSSSEKISSGIIECDMMERIAKKSYLQPLAHTHRSMGNNTPDAIIQSSKGSSSEWPTGIPRQLRILVIDVPEFREMMDEQCRVDLKHLFCDGVAPPKRVEIKHNSSSANDSGTILNDPRDDLNKNRVRSSSYNGLDTTTALEVMQKSFATSLTRCGSNDGVILLEASVSAMDESSELQRLIGGDDRAPNTKRNDSEKRKRYTSFGLKVAEEENASSNQYAWIEELHLRLQGRVPFGAVLVPSSSISRYLFGNVYRWTSRSWFWRMNMNEGENVDGSVTQSKPHAVIADGGALNTVPGALRELVAACRASDVPLWVINDPRVWVTTENDDLETAAASLRKEIKAKIVARALQIKEGTTFERGRCVGRTEAEIKHTAKEAANAVKRLASRLKRDSWKNLSEDELRLELIRRGVCSEIDSTKRNSKELEAARGAKEMACTGAMVDLCRRIMIQSDTTAFQLNQEANHHGSKNL